MNTNSMKMKTSFSIENILSKSDRIAKSGESSATTSNSKIQCTELNSGRSDNNFVVKNENGLTTPDSSCCDEENADTLSDITSEESCKFKYDFSNDRATSN